MKRGWPRATTYWTERRTLYASVPFTWELPAVRARLSQVSTEWDTAVVGGPAVALMPKYLDGMGWVTIRNRLEGGALRYVNPDATRTTEGCPNHCGFCAIGLKLVEPVWRELDDWEDRPVLMDNNILASSQRHFDRVCDRLEKHGRADFNQGVDARLLTDYHADRLVRIGRPMVRLALDNEGMYDEWQSAYDKLRSRGLPKSLIRSYALVGYNDNPESAWRRCEWVQGHGVDVLPMWFHTLDAMEHNAVTKDQQDIGWTCAEMENLMHWYYKHRGHRGPLA